QAGAEHALDVAGHGVDFEVHGAAGDQVAQGGVLHRVGDEVDAEDAALGLVVHAVDGEAHAVDCDGALVGQVTGQLAGGQDFQLPAFADGLEALHRAGAVDVAGDDVAAEPVLGAQGFFQVQPGTDGL